MKRFIALLLVLMLSVGVMASCKKNQGNPPEVNREDVGDLNLDPNGWTKN